VTRATVQQFMWHVQLSNSLCDTCNCPTVYVTRAIVQQFM